MLLQASNSPTEILSDSILLSSTKSHKKNKLLLQFQQKHSLNINLLTNELNLKSNVQNSKKSPQNDNYSTKNPLIVAKNIQLFENQQYLPISSSQLDTTDSFKQKPIFEEKLTESSNIVAHSAQDTVNDFRKQLSHQKKMQKVRNNSTTLKNKKKHSTFFTKKFQILEQNLFYFDQKMMKQQEGLDQQPPFEIIVQNNENFNNNKEPSIEEIKIDIYEEKNSLNEYIILENLGEGIQGKVKKIQNKFSKELFAAKTFRNVDDEIKIQIISEFNILKDLHHSKILKVHNLLNIESSEPIIIMEFFEGQNLKKLFDEESLTEEDILKIIEQLLEVITYLHSQQIIHRDIQIRNIMYNPITKEMKLIDFGLAQKGFENQQNFSPCGYKMYQPPEMLNFEQYTNKVDIWQVGHIFYQLIEKNLLCSKKIINYIKKSELPFLNTSQNIQELIKNLLKINQQERLEASSALFLFREILCTK